MEYLQRAKKCAQELNEHFYITSVDIALGDYYYNQKDYKNALKAYEKAKETANSDFDKDNLQKMTEKLILNDVASNVFESNECNSEDLLKAYFIEMLNSDSYKEIKLFIADQIDFSQIVSLINKK